MSEPTNIATDGEQIVRYAQDGNLGAFGVLFTQFGARVYGYLRAQLWNPLAAGDLTEEVFVQVWEKLGDFEIGSQPFETFVYQVANQVLEKHTQKPSPDNMDTMPYIPKNWEYDGIYGMLRPLPRLIRQILILRHIHGLSYEEMSYIYSLRPFFIQMLYSMGMRRFNEILKERKPDTVGNGAAWLAWQETQLFPAMDLIRQSSTRLHHIIHMMNNARQVREYNARVEQFKRESERRFTPRKLTMQAVMAAVMIFVLLFSSAGTALAAQSSLPGEVLYNTKLTTEDVRLAISLNPLNDARLHAAFALTRLDEIDKLVDLEYYQYLDGVMDNFCEHVEAVEALKAQVDLAADQALSDALSTLETRISAQIDALVAVQAILPGELQALVGNAKDMLAHQQATVIAIVPDRETSGKSDAPIDDPVENQADTETPISAAGAASSEPTATPQSDSIAPTVTDAPRLTATPTSVKPTAVLTLVKTTLPTSTPAPALVATQPAVDEKATEKAVKEDEKEADKEEKEDDKEEEKEEKEDEKEEKEDEKEEKKDDKDKTK
ncbi:MAG: hypothetical protein JW963_00805 [Anaerolineales bacterium]|nr:hypothetical protein [Anaerolineales bacterium]